MKVKSVGQTVTVSDFFADTKTKKLSPSDENKKTKWVSSQERKNIEKLNNYVSYTAKDATTESALAINKNTSDFDKNAYKLSVDISADDDKGIYKQQKQKIWFDYFFFKLNLGIVFRDRKSKKYVSADSNDKVKKIRTEEGVILPATYKSGRYSKWQEQKKVNFQSESEEASSFRNNSQTRRNFKNGNFCLTKMKNEYF